MRKISSSCKRYKYTLHNISCTSFSTDHNCVISKLKFDSLELRILKMKNIMFTYIYLMIFWIKERGTGTALSRAATRRRMDRTIECQQTQIELRHGCRQFKLTMQEQVWEYVGGIFMRAALKSQEKGSIREQLSKRS